ncbi:hypothetical protein LguiA_012704 [Lonicera macranthoides]
MESWRKTHSEIGIWQQSREGENSSTKSRDGLVESFEITSKEVTPNDSNKERRKESRTDKGDG